MHWLTVNENKEKIQRTEKEKIDPGLRSENTTAKPAWSGQSTLFFWEGERASGAGSKKERLSYCPLKTERADVASLRVAEGDV